MYSSVYQYPLERKSKLPVKVWLTAVTGGAVVRFVRDWRVRHELMAGVPV